MAKSRKLLGFALMTAPIAALMLILSSYAIVTFVTETLAANGQNVTNLENIGMITNVALGFLGVFAVLGIIVGLPIGLYLIIDSDQKHTKKMFDLAKTGRVATGLIIFSTALQTLALLAPMMSDTPYSGDRGIMLLVVALVSGLVILCAGIGYLVWLYQATSNLELAHKQPRYSPAWAVVLHFIPLVNLIAPIVVMNDVYEKSSYKHESGGVLVLLWWSCYAVAMTSNLLFNESLGQETTNTLAISLRILSNILLLVLIQRITTNQEHLHAKV